MPTPSGNRAGTLTWYCFRPATPLPFSISPMPAGSPTVTFAAASTKATPPSEKTLKPTMAKAWFLSRRHFLVGTLAAAVGLSSCRLRLPLVFTRKNTPASSRLPNPGVGMPLEEKARIFDHTILSHHLSPEGILLYKRFIDCPVGAIGDAPIW